MPAANPSATVDVALFTLRGEELCVMLAERDREPFQGKEALIGGYIHVDEDDDTAGTARRVLKEKTGLTVAYLEQLYTFSGKYRDPRGWSLSVSYYAVVPESQLAVPTVRLVPVEAVPALPFDHNRIIEQAVKRLRNKSTYSSLPAFLLPQDFSITELHAVYEKVTGMVIDRQNFRRKVLDQGMIEPSSKVRRGAFRPTKLYRLVVSNLTEFDKQIY
jgi:8-oxo-dGTP diphosphatase